MYNIGNFMPDYLFLGMEIHERGIVEKIRNPGRVNVGVPTIWKHKVLRQKICKVFQFHLLLYVEVDM